MKNARFIFPWEFSDEVVIVKRGLIAARSNTTGGEAGNDADAQAVIDQMDAVGTAPDSTQETRINTLVVALKAAGVWDKCDVILGLRAIAAAEGAGVKINWKNPTGTAWVDTGAGSITYATDGTTSDGTNYLLGPDNLSALTQYTQNSAHISIWCCTNAQVNNVAAGDEGGNTLMIRPRTGGDVFLARASGGADVSVANVNSVGMFAAERHDATDIQTFKAGAQVGTASVASVARPARKPAVFRGNGGVSTNKLGFCSIGASLDSTEMDALFDAVTAYMA